MLQGDVKNTVSLQKQEHFYSISLWTFIDGTIGYCRDHTDAAAAPEPHWNQYQRWTVLSLVNQPLPSPLHAVCVAHLAPQMAGRSHTSSQQIIRAGQNQVGWKLQYVCYFSIKLEDFYF